MSVYTEAVARQLAGLDFVSPGLAAICETCREAHGYFRGDAPEDDARAFAAAELIDEGSVGRGACDACGSMLGGNRYAAHGFTAAGPRGELVHLDICEDCLFYLANGDEPSTWEV